MKVSIIVLAILSIATNAQLPFPDPSCSWVANLTDVQDLPQHRYMILEDCLYYNLSQEADQSTGKGNTLVLLPPTKEVGDKITFNVHNVIVRQVWMNELWKDMTINGYMHVSWMDHRLKWNIQKWKLDTLNIKTYGHVWVPDINSERYQTATQSNDFTMYHNIQAKNNGNISAVFEYRMQAICETDFENYPQDINHCCFNMKSYLFEKIVEYKVWQRDGHVDQELAQTNWDLRDINAETRSVDPSNKVQSIRVCLKAARQSSTLKIELTVPMVVSAVLVLIAPLFGTMQSQIYVKLFALLLQFLCFQFLVTRTPQAGLGDATPKLYRFYEFTLGMTLASLMVTLLAGAISNMERSMPPSHRLVLMATAFNNRLCCGGVRWDYTNGSNTDLPQQQNANGKAAVDYRRDWREIFIAVNNLCSIVLMISYIIGVITLTS